MSDPLDPRAPAHDAERQDPLGRFLGQPRPLEGIVDDLRREFGPVAVIEVEPPPTR